MKLAILVIANFVASLAMGVALTIVPWQLAKSAGGEQVLALTATYASGLLIFLSPVSGRLVDRFSRRKLMVLSFVLMGAVLLLATLGYQQPDFRLWGLAAFFFASQVFFLFLYQARTAFIQEVFAEQERARVNSWMEVEMQSSTFLAGVIAIFALQDAYFAVVLFLTAAMLITAGLLILFIPYNKQPRPKQATLLRTVLKSLLRRKDLLLLGVCANLPYVAVMLLNVVHPVYISKVLQMDVAALATASLSYAIGAAVFGYAAAHIIRWFGELTVIATTLFLFSCALLGVSLMPVFSMIVAVAVVLGSTNALTRVTFMTYAMKKVSPHIMGSYLSIIHSLTYVQRTVFSLLLSLLIVYAPDANYYYFVFAVACLGPVGFFVYALIASEQIAEVESTPEAA
ncbi:Major Facilitator Superfamily protein [Pseudovibrio axinellae]|uniref:Major Facilitator Superfamily protein n=1 Tax=Pseudovibrio axinellae TaxID=989403 RepID=A0A165YM95_9HYPH|nr:MFS transporter [Pseudovibrio axinellae]KZL18979.1 Major Facilitator Superfamily protein [Pseudovibrio axinellae]SEP85326.1 Major Facilitator Superfamily protein [Pseudovibrio axinellae]